ncbi:UNVERIFIED_CONTAM: hypothetical protein H355_008040 [Colinus virginianus]|nr:hypothetical protein H355_008040 [Colinus virginianus]
MEEQDSEMVLVEEDNKDLCLSSSEGSSGQASVFTSLSFPQKLWVLAESGEVKSVWWGLGGNCLVIEEELFLVEVLAREGAMRVFGCTSIKSFVRQLNHYGFTKVPWDVERSPSLPEFLAEEEVFASSRKAPLDALSFLCTSFAMAMMSLDWQPWAAPHCPTCTCCQHREDAGPGTAT